MVWSWTAGLDENSGARIARLRLATQPKAKQTLAHHPVQFQTAEIDIDPHSRGAMCPRFASHVPLKTEGAGKAGRRSARSRACSVVTKRVSHHGHTGITRLSPRNGFNGFLRALPGDRALLPPSSRGTNPAKLDASVGASGPHDFAVRISIIRPRTLCRSAITSRA